MITERNMVQCFFFRNIGRRTSKKTNNTCITPFYVIPSWFVSSYENIRNLQNRLTFLKFVDIQNKFHFIVVRKTEWNDIESQRIIGYVFWREDVGESTVQAPYTCLLTAFWFYSYSLLLLLQTTIVPTISTSTTKQVAVIIEHFFN